MAVRPVKGSPLCGRCKLPPGAHGVEWGRIWRRFGAYVSHPFRFGGGQADAP